MNLTTYTFDECSHTCIACKAPYIGRRTRQIYKDYFCSSECYLFEATKDKKVYEEYFSVPEGKHTFRIVPK